MGRPTISGVIDTITGIGLRAERGYPGRKLPQIEVPAVAVSVYYADAERVTFAAVVNCPSLVGSVVCEDEATGIRSALQSRLGLVCSQGACEYDRQACLFSVRVLATWQRTAQIPEQSSVAMDSVPLPNVTGFSARQAVTLTHSGTLLTRDSQTWSVTVEQMLPPGAALETYPDRKFDLSISRATGTEVYPDCRWESITRTDTPDGVHQVRIAKTASDRFLAVG